MAPQPPAGGRTVHLVRHGQSTWNVEGRLQGQTSSPPLTELGVSQARAAADELAQRIHGTYAAPVSRDVSAGRTRVVRLLSSDLVRARQTAAVIGERLGAPVELDVDLREQGLGELEGRLTRELRPEPVPAGAHASEIRWGGGESIRDVHERVVGLVERLRRAVAPGGDVVLVTHGDTLRVLLAVLRGGGHRDVSWEAPVANGSVHTLSLDSQPVA